MIMVLHRYLFVFLLTHSLTHLLIIAHSKDRFARDESYRNYDNQRAFDIFEQFFREFDMPGTHLLTYSLTHLLTYLHTHSLYCSGHGRGGGRGGSGRGMSHDPFDAFFGPSGFGSFGGFGAFGRDMDTDFGMGKSLTHLLTYLLTHSLIDLSTGQGMSSFSSFSSSSSSFGGSGKSGKSVSTSTYIGPDGRKVTKKSTTIYKPDGSQVNLLTHSLTHSFTHSLTHSLSCCRKPTQRSSPRTHLWVAELVTVQAKAGSQADFYHTENDKQFFGINQIQKVENEHNLYFVEKIIKNNICNNHNYGNIVFYYMLLLTHSPTHSLTIRGFLGVFSFQFIVFFYIHYGEIFFIPLKLITYE